MHRQQKEVVLIKMCVYIYMEGEKVKKQQEAQEEEERGQRCVHGEAEVRGEAAEARRGIKAVCWLLQASAQHNTTPTKKREIIKCTRAVGSHCPSPTRDFLLTKTHLASHWSAKLP